jgi:hypothetical protein
VNGLGGGTSCVLGNDGGAGFCADGSLCEGALGAGSLVSVVGGLLT